MKAVTIPQRTRGLLVHRHGLAVPLDEYRGLFRELCRRIAGGRGIRPRRFDVTGAGTAGHALETLLSGGPIQVVVNNAGIHADAPLAGMSATQWNGVVAVCLNGFFSVTQPLLLPMMATRWGRVISIPSPNSASIHLPSCTNSLFPTMPSTASCSRAKC